MGMAREMGMARDIPVVDGVEHHFVEANGIRIHYAEAGPPEADALVMLHGWPQHWYMWRHLIGPLAETRRVICPDLRGFGWSEAPGGRYEKETLADDLFALLDVLEIERTALIAHDWGGWVGFLACLREPQRFEGYLVLGIVPPFAAVNARSIAASWRFWYQLLIASPLGASAVGASSSRLGDAVYRWIGADVWDDAEREAFLGQFQEPARARASVSYYRTFQLRELPALLGGRYRDAHLRVPTRLLFGLEERAMSPAMLAGAEDHADDLQVELVPGVGHFIADQSPELVLTRAKELFA